MRLAVSMFLTVMFVAAAFASPSDKGQEGVDLLSKAASLQILRSPDAKPFRLHVTIHAEHIVATPTDGTYDEVWLSRDKWQRKIRFPGLEQAEIGDVDSKWMSRNLDFQPEIVNLTQTAILPRLQLQSQESVADVHKAKKDSIEVNCIRTRFRQVALRELCFNNSGLLVSEEEGNKRFEFGDYASLGDKMYPRHIRVFYHKKEVLIAQMDTPVLLADAVATDFQRPAGAIQLTVCDKSAIELANRVAPHYPEEARSRRIEGTVVMYVLISGDGRIARTRILETAGDSLDRAATEAVQQWTYKRVACTAKPLPLETEVVVNFTLG